MGKEVEVEERGRILIPKELREELHLRPGQKLLIERKGKEIIVKAPIDASEFISELQGCVKKSSIKPTNIKKIWEKL